MMEYLFHFLLGLGTAFIASLAPGMLNMTAVRTRLTKGQKATYQFALGASCVLATYAFAAMFFTNYILQHPEIVEHIKRAAIGIFIGLAIFFFWQAQRKVTTANNTNLPQGKSFLNGMTMATLNALVVPFYFTTTSYYQSQGYMHGDFPYTGLFSIGVFFGAMTLFYVYNKFAVIIEKRAQFISRNINYILSALFILLTFIQLFL